MSKLVITLLSRIAALELENSQLRRENGRLTRSEFRARMDSWKMLLVGLSAGGCIGAVIGYLL